jgi:hypothetical protein
LTDSAQSKVALLGFSVAAMEGLEKADRPFVAVVPPAFGAYMEEHDIPHVLWDFSRLNDKSGELAQTLMEMDVHVAVPLFEETVEWAGALNGRFRDDPRLFSRYLLFRDKAMMKRRAQMSGIRVGLFEEAEEPRDVERFLQRVQRALTKLDSDEPAMIHMKPIDAAGALGHKVLRRVSDAQNLAEDDFPCLLETHLAGQEFSVEAFVHEGRIRFMNITEYIKLGHTNFVPASPDLEARRPIIRRAVEALIAAFDIEYGMIHPEFFITDDDVVSFGEVAARVPGGHIFELIQRAWGFDPFVGFAMCCDPNTTDEELAAFFPNIGDHDLYAGCVMVYPKQRRIAGVELPDELLENDYYERHNLFMPVNQKVAERAAFGNHYGSVFFAGPSPDVMRELLVRYDRHEFYRAPEEAAENEDA